MPQRRGAFTSCFWDECTWGISLGPKTQLLSGVLRLGGCLLALPLSPLAREVSGNLKWPFCLRPPTCLASAGTASYKRDQLHPRVRSGLPRRTGALGLGQRGLPKVQGGVRSLASPDLEKPGEPSPQVQVGWGFRGGRGLYWSTEGEGVRQGRDLRKSTARRGPWGGA